MADVIDGRWTNLSYLDVVALNNKFAALDAAIAGLSGGGGGMQVNAKVTPHAGGGQEGAMQLDYGSTPVVEAATTGDSFQLPLAVGNTECVLVPQPASGANATSIWPKLGSSDTINGVPAADVIMVNAAGIFGSFICPEGMDGQWFSNCGPLT